MELPSMILVGYGIIEKVSEFLGKLNLQGPIVLVSGPNIKRLIGDKIEGPLLGSGYKYSWHLVNSATLAEVKSAEETATSMNARLLIGYGGGKSVDIAKLAAYNLGIPFVSVPTCASHDGISSPFASIKGYAKPYSLKAKSPVGILADVELMQNAPPKLLASGCGDLISKLIAVKDWTLGRDEKGEYYGKYAASLAMLSAEIVIEEAPKIGKGERESVRAVVEALISAGVAAGVAGSSRPCSGSEHLFAHALGLLAPATGLHGEECGVGSIIMSKLYGAEWERITDSLKMVHAPTTAKELDVDPELIVKALLLAPTIRPERYTILSKARLNEASARGLARSAGVLS